MITKRDFILRCSYFCEKYICLYYLFVVHGNIAGVNFIFHFIMIILCYTSFIFLLYFTLLLFFLIFKFFPSLCLSCSHSFSLLLCLSLNLSLSLSPFFSESLFLLFPQFCHVRSLIIHIVPINVI